MKLFKKMLGLAVSAAMVLSMGIVPAMAAGEYTITINDTFDGHTYNAYQVFAGTLTTETSGSTTTSVLSNISWGSGVTEAYKTAKGDAQTFADTLDTEANAKALAKELVEGLNGTSYLSSTYKTGEFASNKYTISGLDAGYYVITDSKETLGAGDAYSSYIVKVVGDVNVDPKTAKPTVKKEVKDIDDKTGTVTNWTDSADYDIGDTVPFKLTATIGDVSDFNYYRITFQDTLSAGLTYTDGQTVAVKINDNTVTDTYYTIVPEEKADGTTVLTVKFNDIKALLTKTSEDDKNTVTVEYTAELDTDAVIGNTGNPNTVKLFYSHDPKVNEDKDPTGETTDYTVKVFTYKLVVDKYEMVNNAETPLLGAGFTLYKKVPTSDTYTDGLKKVAEYNAGDKSNFEFTGLDDGDYVLKETKVPGGYNEMADVEFTINPTHDKEQISELEVSVTAGTADITVGDDKGTLTTKVENKKGATFPETGGMGTKALYGFGGLLVLVASVLLVSKRRMQNN